VKIKGIVVDFSAIEIQKNQLYITKLGLLKIFNTYIGHAHVIQEQACTKSITTALPKKGREEVILTVSTGQ
jgi:hypothetical protein